VTLVSSNVNDNAELIVNGKIKLKTNDKTRLGEWINLTEEEKEEKAEIDNLSFKLAKLERERDKLGRLSEGLEAKI
jgi:hypothetical protein